MLLKLGAKSNIQELDYGSTPLHKAAFSGNAGIIQTLLRGGADSQILNNLGQKAIEIARLYRHTGVVDVLVQLAIL